MRVYSWRDIHTKGYFITQTGIATGAKPMFVKILISGRPATFGEMAKGISNCLSPRYHSPQPTSKPTRSEMKCPYADMFLSFPSTSRSNKNKRLNVCAGSLQ
ncbi:uncharacterized protein LY79DRAFT_214749 [Colletotrichum navitas]|uniref:Uncharacterized protein n=1 Tax=Colletotrichum navitas TaxID=681940 RepID=A0AAD8V4P0_9PEZI|nr:uncharacterized protein LY79DRAFT_214749 [Colletotrichum navitas]KAK1590597.1 hypothetical protein LY79DRAFT_214749 [Colletotrichum navitas]